MPEPGYGKAGGPHSAVSAVCHPYGADDCKDVVQPDCHYGKTDRPACRQSPFPGVGKTASQDHQRRGIFGPGFGSQLPESWHFHRSGIRNVRVFSKDFFSGLESAGQGGVCGPDCGRLSGADCGWRDSGEKPLGDDGIL